MIRDDLVLGTTAAQELVSNLDPADIDVLKSGKLTEGQTRTLFATLQKIGEEGTRRFGDDASVWHKDKICEFLKTAFREVISDVVKTMRSQSPDVVREADMQEAVFSHVGDAHPILATHSLSPCIGVGGYDPANGYGFVIHFATETDVTTSGSMLEGIINKYRSADSSSTLLIHLRGGIKGMSEPTLEAILEWLKHSGIPYSIASDKTLQVASISGTGWTDTPASIRLDIRTGACEEYLWEKNPYSKKHERDIADFSVEQIFRTVLTRKGITVVYDPKK
jgi:hypothetical protein